MKIKIENDVFDIINRLKEIDEGYYIVYNTNSKKNEIHNKYTKNSYCLTIPYSQLDERTIVLANNTHVRNYKKILESIEENNDRLQTEKIEELKEVNDYKIRELLKYSRVETERVLNAFKTTWI